MSDDDDDDYDDDDDDDDNDDDDEGKSVGRHLLLLLLRKRAHVAAVSVSASAARLHRVATPYGHSRFVRVRDGRRGALVQYSNSCIEAESCLRAALRAARW